MIRPRARRRASWERLLARAAFLGIAPVRASQRTLIIAPTGGGNLGDQALVEAALALRPDAVVISPASDAYPLLHAGGHRVIDLPDLFSGRQRPGRTRIPTRRYAALRAAARQVGRCGEVAVIGADTIDGSYNSIASIRRLAFAEAAARSGASTRIISMSWSSPPPGVAAAARHANDAGVVFVAREQRSHDALRADGIDAIAAADLSFAVHDAAPAPVPPPERPYAVVNASGLIASRLDTADEYDEIVEALRRRGLHIVVVAHVTRATSDDTPHCRALVERHPGAVLAEGIDTPRTVRTLCRGASVIVSGRMHLAALALGQGVPAIALETSGKVAGLMESAGLPRFAIATEPGFGTAVAAVLDEALAESTRARLADRVSQLRLAASLNLAAENAPAARSPHV